MLYCIKVPTKHISKELNINIYIGRERDKSDTYKKSHKKNFIETKSNSKMIRDEKQNMVIFQKIKL